MKYYLAPFDVEPAGGADGVPLYYAAGMLDVPHGIIDLRPEGKGTAGYCLLGTNEPVGDQRAVLLAEDGAEMLAPAARQALDSRLGVTLDAGGSFGAAVFNLLTEHATPPGDKSRWNPVRRSWRPGSTERSYQVWLGGQLIHEAGIVAARHQTIVVEDGFSAGASGDDLNAIAPDTTNTPGNQWDVNTHTDGFEFDGSGAVYANANGDRVGIDANAVDAHGYVDFNAGGADNRFHMFVRGGDGTATNVDGAFNDCYSSNLRTDDGTPARLLRRASSETQIASGSPSINSSATYTIGCKADGSSISFTVNGSDVAGPTTDTAHTAGGWAGMAQAKYVNSNMRWDDFIVDDLAAAAAALSVNHGGTWKTPISAHVNDGGTWKQAEAYVKSGGVWVPAE